MVVTHPVGVPLAQWRTFIILSVVSHCMSLVLSKNGAIRSLQARGFSTIKTGVLLSIDWGKRKRRHLHRADREALGTVIDSGASDTSRDLIIFMNDIRLIANGKAASTTLV